MTEPARRKHVPLRLLALAGAALALVTAASARAAITAGTPAARPAAPITLGTGGWKVLTSATATQTGQQISTPGFSTAGWLSVTPDDAGAPGTEIEALLQNGGCANVFFSDNMRKCFGFTSSNGPVSVAKFKVPWWYRTDFTANLAAGQTASLIVNGVVGAADVFVDGKQVATKSTVTGAYTRFTFDVTGTLRSGTNSLAIKMYPNDPSSMLTLDDVDWNQIPPDNNTGIQFPVQLKVAGALSESNAHVVQSNAADLSSSSVTVKTDVTNNTGSSQTGTVAPQGVRRYAINGRSFVTRGAGYVPELFLHYSSASAASHIALLKSLGLNMIRLEGHFMPEDFYRQADAAGMMIDAGYQCCDAWEPGGTPSQADLNIMRLSALTVGQNERNHPSVVTFSWSDNNPVPAQETVSL